MVGNPTTFTPQDLVRTLLAIGESPVQLSRSALAERLELGEGAMRTILDMLKARKMVTATQRGHRMTAKGAEWHNAVRMHCTAPMSTALALYPRRKVVVSTLHGAKAFSVAERDLAVQEGAEGVLLATCRQGKLIIPGYGKSLAELAHKINLKEGDTVIAVFGASQRICERALIRIAARLQPQLAQLFVIPGSEH